MRHSPGKILFFSLIGIFLFSCPVYLEASKTVSLSYHTGRIPGEHLAEPVSTEQANRPTNTTPAFQSRWEIYEVLFGTQMVIIGLVAVALALYRWKPNDLSLISFGSFCFLYGARTRAFQFLVDAPLTFWAHSEWLLTYLTPVAAYIFFEQFIGKGWKSSIRLFFPAKQRISKASVSPPATCPWHRLPEIFMI
jgi:hypothetical protein